MEWKGPNVSIIFFLYLKIKASFRLLLHPVSSKLTLIKKAVQVKINFKKYFNIRC